MTEGDTGADENRDVANLAMACDGSAPRDPDAPLDRPDSQNAPPNAPPNATPNATPNAAALTCLKNGFCG